MLRPGTNRRGLRWLLVVTVVGGCARGSQGSADTATVEPEPDPEVSEPEPEPDGSKPVEPEDSATSGEDPSADLPAESPDLAAQKQSISAIIKANIPELTACYEAQLGDDSSLAGKTRYTITIEAGGWVSAVVIDEDDLGSEAVHSCAAARMREWAFTPAADGEAAEVSFAVAYTPV